MLGGLRHTSPEPLSGEKLPLEFFPFDSLPLVNSIGIVLQFSPLSGHEDLQSLDMEDTFFLECLPFRTSPISLFGLPSSPFSSHSVPVDEALLSS